MRLVRRRAERRDVASPDDQWAADPAQFGADRALAEPEQKGANRDAQGLRPFARAPGELTDRAVDHDHFAKQYSPCACRQPPLRPQTHPNPCARSVKSLRIITL